MTVSEDYDAAFFAMHEPWQADYDEVAGALKRHLEFASVLDLGCGNGFLIDRLEQLGAAVRGVDGSQHAAACNRRVEVRDLTRPLHVGSFDLVICTEVAEHLSAEHADTLVDNICRAARGAVYFSAAAPGYGGHLHVNERPRPYWQQKFRARGFALDARRTRAIAADLRFAVVTTWWFAQNGMVLAR